MQAIADRARPGVTEYQLRAAAGAAILEGGGDIDFLIIGSTPMADPAQVFGNPRPSSRKLAEGDIILMELAAGYRGYSAQIGQPICLGEPPAECAPLLGRDRQARLSNDDRRDRAGQSGRRSAHRRRVLPPERRAVAADPLPRHRLRLRRPARLSRTTSTSSRSRRS